MKQMIRVIRLINSKYKHAVAKLIVCSLIISAFLGLASKAASEVLDLFIVGDEFKIILIFVGVFLLRALSGGLQSWVTFFSTKVSETIAISMQEDVLQKMETIAFENYDNPENRNTIVRIRENIGRDGAEMLKSLSLAIYGVLTLLVYSALLSSITWYMALILFAASILSVWISVRFGMDNYFLQRRNSVKQRMVSYYESLLLKREGAKEMRAFNLQEHLLDRYISMREELTRDERKQLTKFTLFELFGKIAQAFGFFACLVVCCINIGSGSQTITIGDVMLVLTLGMMFFDGFDAALQQLQKLSSFYVFADDVLLLTGMTDEQPDKAKFPERTPLRIQFHNVSFSYPGANVNALNDISLDIKEGETIVCVGANGSGKTTFVNLLLGLYAPAQGSIAVSGIDLSNIKQGFRRITACVLQTYNKYQMSVRENIYTGNAEQNSRPSDSIGKFIDELPGGMNTHLGQLDEHSVELSGGQWQRLAILRAFAKKDVKLFIMDECTASLDPLSESVLYDELKSKLKQYTTIIMSHRLGVCSLADRILVFSKGSIAECGTHAELINQKGIYYDMYKKQTDLLNAE